MPKPDYSVFFKKAASVIRQSGNPLNMHSSRMAERASSLTARLKSVAKDAILSPEEFERIGSQAGEFRASEQAMRNFTKGTAGKQAGAMTAKYTRSGILASGSKAGTIAKEVLKDIGAAAGSSFSELTKKAAEAYNKLKPGLKPLLDRSAEVIRQNAAAGDKAAISAMKGNVFKFVTKGWLPSVTPLDIVDVIKTAEEAEIRQHGA